MLTAICMYVTGSKLCVKVLLALFLATARTWRVVQWGVGRVWEPREQGLICILQFSLKDYHSRDRRCEVLCVSEAVPGHPCWADSARTAAGWAAACIPKEPRARWPPETPVLRCCQDQLLFPQTCSRNQTVWRPGRRGINGTPASGLVSDGADAPTGTGEPPPRLSRFLAAGAYVSPEESFPPPHSWRRRGCRGRDSVNFLEVRR